MKASTIIELTRDELVELRDALTFWLESNDPPARRELKEALWDRLDWRVDELDGVSYSR